MKKILSTLLVGAMVLSMAPAVFAGEAAGTTIKNADEYIAMVEALNDATIADPASPITVTGDLDFSGKTYTPIKTLPADYVLDFGGHAIMNLKYEVEVTATSELGLIAGSLANRAEVKNLVLKNSSLTVKDADGDDTKAAEANVGAIAGRLDRASATNISTDNFTITSDCAGYVALVGAFQHWAWNEHLVVYCGNLKDLTIDAPNATVGILSGWAQEYGSDAMHIAVKDLTGNVTIKGAANLVTNETFIGKNTLTTIKSEDEFASGQNQYYLDSDSVKIELTNTTDIYKEAYKFITIDSAQEFAEFTAAVNDGSYKPSGTVKVTADLNMKDVAYAPIDLLTFSLDFDGHTVSNLKVDTAGNGGNAGLIANKTNNGTSIDNIVIKDSSLTTTATTVGIVVGYADRCSVPNATIENVTVKADAATTVGAVIGEKAWSCANPDMNATLKNVTIDAAKETVVGMLVGTLSGETKYGAGKVNVTGLTVSGLTVVDATMADDAVIGKNAVAISEGAEADVTVESHFTYAEDAKVSIDLDGDGKTDADVDTSNKAETDKKDDTTTTDKKDDTTTTDKKDDTTSTDKKDDTTSTDKKDPVKTGDATVFAVVLAVIALAGAAVISKKRSAC